MFGGRMKEDAIAEVGIQDSGGLYVRPTRESLPYIYREGVEVHWDTKKKLLYSPKPREWSYFDWFRHIIGTAKVQSLCSSCLRTCLKMIQLR